MQSRGYRFVAPNMRVIYLGERTAEQIEELSKAWDFLIAVKQFGPWQRVYVAGSAKELRRFGLTLGIKKLYNESRTGSSGAYSASPKAQQ